MRRSRIITVALICSVFITTIGFVGCATGRISNSLFRKRKTQYQIGELPPGWKEVRVSGADLSYMHDSDGSTLLVNADCESTGDTPLAALTFHLLIGMTEQKVIEQKAVPNSEREGLMTIAEASLDGVKRKFKIFVLKKDYCIYDIVFASEPKLFDQNSAAFDSMLKGFNIPGAKL